MAKMIYSAPVEIVYVQRPPLPKLPTTIFECCREWIGALGFPPGSCGICGERPTYKRPDPDSPTLEELS